MTTKELRERIAKIIDQLRRGETTSHIVEEIRKSADKKSKKAGKKPK